ncbi:unnamed protein product [Diatraea saccharalis]|uniref:Ig-like domain-containing protein n=1 Tax=Diatraea saccharalis TaxID=40085 RepID=A0A9N9QXU7_9NEOP|nr:unnamed protein product [Diatraea saccharalis]
MPALGTVARALSTCWLLLCALAGSHQLSITEFAVPSTVEAGNNAELQCLHSDAERVDYVKWWWTPMYAASEDKNRVLLYQRLTGHTPEIPKKNVEGRENDTIVLMDLHSYDSGVYECEVSNVAEVRRHQELIVYSNGTGVELNVSKVEDGPDEDDLEEVLVQCEVHEATPLPDLSIFVDDVKFDNVTVDVEEDSNGVYNVFLNLTLSSDVVADGSNIRCELSYPNHNVSHQYTSEIVYNSDGVSNRSRWILYAVPVVFAILNNLL